MKSWLPDSGINLGNPSDDGICLEEDGSKPFLPYKPEPIFQGLDGIEEDEEDPDDLNAQFDGIPEEPPSEVEAVIYGDGVAVDLNDIEPSLDLQNISDDTIDMNAIDVEGEQ